MGLFNKAGMTIYELKDPVLTCAPARTRTLTKGSEDLCAIRYTTEANKYFVKLIYKIKTFIIKINTLNNIQLRKYR